VAASPARASVIRNYDLTPSFADSTLRQPHGGRAV
jgi:hypothetical protein